METGGVAFRTQRDTERVRITPEKKKKRVGTRKFVCVNLNCIINYKWTNHNNLYFSWTVKILIRLTVSLDVRLIAYRILFV